MTHLLELPSQRLEVLLTLPRPISSGRRGSSDGASFEGNEAIPLEGYVLYSSGEPLRQGPSALYTERMVDIGARGKK